MRDYRASLWPRPEKLNTDNGEERRLGLELEFIGLDVERTVERVEHCFGGEPARISDYEYEVRDGRLGDIRVELDFSYLKKMGREKEAPDRDKSQAGELAETVLAEIAKHVVPVEVVGPPVPFGELWRFNDLIADLRDAGAKGTRHSPQYAFGLHMNPELPDTQASTVLAYLQAFLCLYDWLKRDGQVDWSRRITPYIDSVPKEYLRRVLATDYAPDQDQLIDDYLALNATRNRAMDMLPLFCHLDEERVRGKVDDDRVQARPTLHYRLPNCQIDEPDWSLSVPWRRWLQVEALAADREKLQAIRKACLDCLRSPGGSMLNDWAEESSRWLVPELL